MMKIHFTPQKSKLSSVANCIRLALVCLSSVVLTSLVAAPVMGQSSAAALPLGDGLAAVYYEGMEFNKVVAKRIDPTIDFDWSFRAPQKGYPFSRFSVRWVGFVYAPVTGRYTIRTISDDGIRVWIDGHLLIDEWRPQPPLVASGQVTLRSGRYYAVRVDYFQADRIGRAFLGWDLPGDPPAFTAEDIYSNGQMIKARKPRPLDPSYFFTRRPAVPAPVSAQPLAKPMPTPVSRKKVTPLPVRARVRPKPTPPVPPAARPVAPSADLNALTTGTTLSLERLYFVQSTAQLRVDSHPELERLVTRLREAPAVLFEIAGHTDNVGDSMKNVQLSQQRATVVRTYLIKHGIDSARVTARGYGGTRPVADNRDPMQRSRNRRVEVVIR
ncbi:MAG TPA: PA14 domain-containing protein [Hymenobacter sp.]|jgi:outer membrane protein OmpA-like peptidoglycan-associated protein